MTSTTSRASAPPRRGAQSRTGAPACPLCGGDSRHVFDARDLNREVTQEHFPYFRCGGCGSVFLAEVPDDLSRYYDEDYYAIEADGQPSWTSGEEQPAERAAAHRVEMVRRYLPSGRLIEIGSGNGAFAVAARDAGFDVSAIEMNERCCRYLDGQAGITAICSERPLEELSGLPRPDVIAIWHVLEHFSDPGEVIRQAAQRLEPGGLLAIAVPNVDSLQFRVLGSRWAHLDAPRHLCLVPARTLVRLGRDAGLSCVAMETNDPDGYECNLWGWARALQRQRADLMSPLTLKVALGICVIAAPLERTGNRGSAITVLMRRDP
jgi:2-polyprenyl-3-methyl-5-hydroxy-6-metoxy-1,4-benzoquinol methylase